MNTAASTSSSRTHRVQQQLHRTNLKGFIQEQGGKMIGLDFVKKDGCARTLTGRMGVTSHLRGGVNYVEAPSRPYLTIFDMKNAGYRSVNLATVSRVSVEGRDYAIVG